MAHKSGRLKSTTRAGTRCKASTPHLHRDTKVLPLRDHSRLLTSHLPGHPGREHLGRPPSARQKKKTVLGYEEKVSSLLPTNPTVAGYKTAIKALHTEVVEETIGRYLVNKVLGVNKEEVNKEEKSLPQTTHLSAITAQKWLLQATEQLQLNNKPRGNRLLPKM